MNNPWLELPKHSPYVLPIDAGAVASFNACAPELHRIHAEIVPEPYLGDPAAPVVLLSLNPGFVDTDSPVHHDERFNAAARANLEHRHPTYPFYLLDPMLRSPGQTWWLKKLRALIVATSVEAVANRIFVVELHGYHSRRFSSKLSLASQEYTRHLVLDAVNRHAILVFMRGRSNWLNFVPELAGVTVSAVRNVQNPTISPGNLDSFAQIVSAVAG